MRKKMVYPVHSLCPLCLCGLFLIIPHAFAAPPDDSSDHPADAVMRMLPQVGRQTIDDAQAAAADIHKHAGRRLTLYTDLAGPEIGRLPEYFDQAFPQWCAYFHVDPDKIPGWKMTGFLMKDKERFVRLGLMPGDLPSFPHGFSRNYELWLYEQPSDYYRRHLLIHEGTHGFMNTVLGGCGPSWYMEGMAELLSTHRLQDGRVVLNDFPRRREEVPEWGRIRIVQDAVAAGKGLSLQAVLDFSPSAYNETAGYAWSWAAAALMDRHPRYQARFRQLHQFVLSPQFRDKFDTLFAPDRRELGEEWQVFIGNLEFDYDVPRMAINFHPGKPLPSRGANVTLDADRGWQNTGYRLQSGHAYRLTAAGRWEKRCRPDCWPGLANLPDKIPIEANGISIRYYHGRPLGQLLAAVRPDNPDPQQPSVFLNPLPVGLKTEITPQESGTLYLRVNDSAAELGDNHGELRVDITKN
jgi:hypothetical protein